MKAKTFGFIGGGRITRIFLQAFQNKGFMPLKVVVTDINSETTAALKQEFPHIEISGPEAASGQEIVLIALHPPAIIETLEKIKEFIQPGVCVISLAPKIDIEKISGKLNGLKNVARLIPSATSVINEGYNPICFSEDFKEKQSIIKWLSLLGKTFEVDEPKLEAYAIISAMLPTYFWFQWRELLQIGVKIGLNENECMEAVEESLIASVHTMFTSGLSYEEVVDLIPVKPIGNHEPVIKDIFSVNLVSLYDKIKP